MGKGKTEDEDYLLMFTTIKQAYMDEADYRANIEFKNLCKYGIKPLDDALLAIAPKELIVIAAGSGIGKTEISLMISKAAVAAGKKVAHYNLEGGSCEAVQRLKWQYMCQVYYDEYKDEGIEMDYRRWVLNASPHPLFMKLESLAYTKILEMSEDRLFLYDNPEGLNCRSFCESLVRLEGLRADMGADPLLRKHIKGAVGIDLIVIDHLHYFSLTKDENENTEITEILKVIKTITEELHIPVVLVAHLRKLPRGHGVPDKEDIFGSSNIHKIANTCLILSPDHEKDDVANGIYPTFIRMAKSRQGLRPNLLINVNFNIHTRKYSDNYELYRCGPLGDVAGEALTEMEKPSWARGPK